MTLRNGTIACSILLLALTGCTTSNDEPKGKPTPSVMNADLVAVAKRWRALSGEDQDRVCRQVVEKGGPDLAGMQRELMDTGLTQPKAAEMLPTIINKCT